MFSIPPPSLAWNLEPPAQCGTRNLGTSEPGPRPDGQAGTRNLEPKLKFFSARLRRAVRTRNLEPAHTGGRNRNLGTLYGVELDP